MNSELKNDVLLSKDDTLYRQWREEIADLTDDLQAFYAEDSAADLFVRRWLNRLNGACPYLIRLFFAEKEFLAAVISEKYRPAFASLLKEAFSRLYGQSDLKPWDGSCAC